MSTHSEIISFFYNHPKYFLRVVSEYYPLNKKELDKYSHFLNWQYVSHNQLINWNEPMVRAFSDRLHWDVFSMNRFFVDDHQIKRFSSQIEWGFGDLPLEGSLAYNPFIHWDLASVEKYKDRLCLKSMSYSNQIEWSDQLIDRYLYDWDWKGLSENEMLPWNLAFFRRYFTFWNIDSYWFTSNGGITGCSEIVEEFWDMLSPLAIFRNDKLPWNEQGLLEKWKDRLCWFGLASNEVLHQNPDFFEKNLSHWMNENRDLFYPLSGNTALAWSIPFFERFIDKWDMEIISTNIALPWSEEFIGRYEGILKWGKYETVLSDIFLDYDGIEECQIIHPGLSDNPALPWSLDFILKNESKIEFEALSHNQSAWDKVFKNQITSEIVETVMRII